MEVKHLVFGSHSQNLASVVTWACRIPIKRCKALVWLLLSGANGALVVGD